MLQMTVKQSFEFMSNNFQVKRNYAQEEIIKFYNY
jgi:hypothetical protein